MKKSELNQNISITDRNNKSVSTKDIYFLTWNLPSILTCPYATEMCKKRCFATKWERVNPKALKSRTQNWEESKKATFSKDMIDWFGYNLQRPKAKGKIIYVRIHTSGDFYNLDYLMKWANIAKTFQDNDRILFQAYTKSMPILDKYINLQRGFYNSNSTDKEIIKETNIHFVWSVWDDTTKEYTERAKELGLQTFTTMTKDKIEKADNKIFICKGDCGNCKQCYVGKAKEIAIPIH